MLGMGAVTLTGIGAGMYLLKEGDGSGAEQIANQTVADISGWLTGGLDINITGDNGYINGVDCSITDKETLAHIDSAGFEGAGKLEVHVLRP